MNRLARSTVLGTALVLLASGCGPFGPAPTAAPAPEGPPPAPVATVTDPNAAAFCMESVTIQNGKVTPARITIKAPCRILFTNRDEVGVQIRGATFLIGELKKDEAWVQTFRDPGTYDWADQNNPDIKGAIVVTP